MVQSWVIKNLREYGNCYVREYPDVRAIEKILKRKVTVRNATNCELGWVIEVEKETK